MENIRKCIGEQRCCQCENCARYISAYHTDEVLLALRPSLRCIDIDNDKWLCDQFIQLNPNFPSDEVISKVIKLYDKYHLHDLLDEVKVIIIKEHWNE